MRHWLGVLSLCFVVSVAAKNPDDVQVRAELIEWPLLQSAATISIQGPDGQVRTLPFDRGQTPHLRLTDAGIADGSYTWELRDEQGVRSGSFAIANGAFVGPDVIESDSLRPATPTTNDQVIPDDLIVNGSVCVGSDCINGETFATRTLVLKENNLRINALDTSGAGFPNTDWVIEFNETQSGGANRFAIQDASAVTTPFGIEAAARTFALWVDATGRIGFGTSMPEKDLHVRVADTPALRLEQQASVYPAQTWDIAGNDANFFIRDVTGGNRLPFRIRPGAPTSAIDVQANGNVGLNCVGATSDLVIASGGGCANPSSSLNAGDAQFTVASSRAFKENLTPLEVPDLLDKLETIDVYRYDFIEGPKDRVGLIAEDFHQIFGRGSEKYIDGNEVQMALWLAVKQLLARIETLEAQRAAVK